MLEGGESVAELVPGGAVAGVLGEHALRLFARCLVLLIVRLVSAGAGIRASARWGARERIGHGPGLLERVSIGPPQRQGHEVMPELQWDMGEAGIPGRAIAATCPGPGRNSVRVT